MCSGGQALPARRPLPPLPPPASITYRPRLRVPACACLLRVKCLCRAGQGGRQSAKDASGKYAKSAGSRLRRYNEVALARDVAEALGGWRELLGSCGLVFVHAPSSNWQQLFGGEAPLLDRGDPRYRCVRVRACVRVVCIGVVVVAGEVRCCCRPSSKCCTSFTASCPCPPPCPHPPPLPPTHAVAGVCPSQRGGPPLAKQSASCAS